MEITCQKATSLLTYFSVNISSSGWEILLPPQSLPSFLHYWIMPPNEFCFWGFCVCISIATSKEIAASNKWVCCTFFLTCDVLLLLLREFVCWQILAALDFFGLRLPLKQRYDVTWKPFPQTSLFSPVLWQPWINILSWTDPTARKYLLTCRKRPLFFSDYLQQRGSACSRPPMTFLPLFSICWTFILYLFYSHFFQLLNHSTWQ